MILVFNVGSSSIKFAVYDKNTCVTHTLLERVTTPAQRKKAVKQIVLLTQNYSITAIGHRIVHGGELVATTKITSSSLKKIKKVAQLAPLHDIPEIEVIEYCKDHFKKPQFAIFDTAFHASIPSVYSTIAVPGNYHIYGFHGISHEYVSQGIKGSILSCHLGSGCSVTAIQNGKSVDTSMGYTPLDGVIMATRSGSVDPGVVLDMVKHMGVKKTEDVLQHKSGLYALCGATDVRDILTKKTVKCTTALEVFCYSVAQQIGKMAVSLPQVQTILFTGGIGENVPLIRSKICSHLQVFGVQIDTKKNKSNADSIHTSKSKVKVFVKHTNEELAIAQKVKHALRR